MTTAPILSTHELDRERAVLAHVEADTRVAVQAKRRADRIAEKAAHRANLSNPRPVADMAGRSPVAMGA